MENKEIQNLKEKVFEFVKYAYEHHPKDGITIDDETFSHLNEVMDTVMTLSEEKDLICAAGLHDIIEKTETEPEEIAEKFNENTSIILNHMELICRFLDVQDVAIRFFP